MFVGVASSAYSYGRGQEIYWADNFNQCWSAGGRGAYVYDVFMGGPLFDQALVQGSPVVYTDVTKYIGNSTGNAGKTVYNYGTASQQMAVTQPLPAGNELANNQGILIINDTWNKGQLLTQQEYKFENNSYSLVQDNQNTYNILYTDTTYGLIAQTNFDRVVINQACETKGFTDYAFAEYPVHSGYVQLAQSTRNDYSSNGSGALQTITNHTYDNIHKDIEVKASTLNSKGETIETEKKYPFNKAQLITSITPAESTALDSMVSKNIITPIEEIKRNNNVQISLKKTGYEYVNTPTIAPVSLRFQNSSNPIETRLLYTKYDSSGNLIEQQKVADAKSSYVWDYQNRYPIAEVFNASQPDVAYTSFEADGNGNWNISSTKRDTLYFITGKRSYKLDSGSISKTGLTVGQAYIISFWSKSATYSITGGTNTITTGRTVGVWTYKENKVVATATTIGISGAGNIDELRLYPVGSQMKSLTYAPLVGATSINDPNSEITFYEYDAFQRLANIKDYQGNIIKNFQYNYAQPCTSCSLVMKTLGGTPTISYPVGVFSVAGNLLGNATTQSQYVSLWNADAGNHTIGTLIVGSDSMHFTLTVNSGQTSPGYVTGCRYFQIDLTYNMIDAFHATSAAYIDFGDGSGMSMPATVFDSNTVRAPNTIINYQYNWESPTGLPNYLYWIHNYPDTSLKTLTFYHNDGNGGISLDNAYSPATSLTKLKNLRGTLPQYMLGAGMENSQQSSMSSYANIKNWNSINSVIEFYLSMGDQGASPNLHVGFAQDFMANNKNLTIISTFNYGYWNEANGDSTFKISRLKSNWNTYFTQLTTLQICDRDWNHEDLTPLIHLNSVTVCAGSRNYNNVQTGNSLIPMTVSAIDNIITGVSNGAGQHISNGVINLLTAGTTRSSVSDAAVTQLKSKGWTITVNGVNQ